MRALDLEVGVRQSRPEIPLEELLGLSTLLVLLLLLLLLVLVTAATTTK